GKKGKKYPAMKSQSQDSQSLKGKSQSPRGEWDIEKEKGVPNPNHVAVNGNVEEIIAPTSAGKVLENSLRSTVQSEIGQILMESPKEE
ncbi:hypothetical protein U1Q18_046973, partial [Sarracenia purpurea var. burkii]